MAADGSGKSDIFTTMVSKSKGTEKKKRKRPSKKVPTTILEASSTNFMDLVQKLTGSAAELAGGKDSDKRPKFFNESPNSATSSPYSSSPYSSPSIQDTIDRPTATESYYQQYLRSTALEYGDVDSSSSSHSSYPNAHPFTPFDAITPSLDQYPQSASATATTNSSYYTTEAGDDDDFFPYSNRTSPDANSMDQNSSRAIENEISPFSSSWREQTPGHSDYWFHHLDQVAAMGA